MKRCALYLRISDDQLAGQGVQEQESRCRALAATHGLEVVTVLSDNDISASSYGKRKRPDYEKLLTLIRTRQIDVVIADDQDRLIRRPAELEELIDTIGVDNAKVQVLTVRAGEHDFSTSSGRLTARIKGAVSAHESELKSERISAKVQAQVTEGIRHGGSRPYGFHRAPKSGPKPCPSCNEMMEREPYGSITRAVVEQCPVEAARIRTFAQLKLEGWSLWKIARMANEQRWPTANGKAAWSAQIMTRLLSSPGLRGERANKNGQANPAAWEAILEPETHDQVKSAIRVKLIKNKSTPTLLGNLKILRCGRCHHFLRVAHPDKKGNPRRYACQKQSENPNHTACGSCSSQVPAVDKRVTELVLRDIALYISDPNRNSQQQKLAALETQEQELNTTLARLTKDFYSPTNRLTPDLFNQAYDNLNTQIQEVQEHKRSVVIMEQTPLPETGSDVQQWWDSLNLTEQRETLANIVHEIILQPTGKGSGGKFRPERVSVTLKFGSITRRANAAPEPTEEQYQEGLKALQED